MKKLGLLLFLFVCAAVVRAQSNIVKSLERNVPGQGKVTIHQDSRIEALLGTARTGTGEQTVIKSSGYRVQAYAGNNTRQAKNEAHQVGTRVKENFRFILLSILPGGCVESVIFAASKKLMP